MADEHPGKEGEKGKEEKKESPLLNAFTLWLLISVVGSTALLGYNYYYNASTGQPITLGNMMFPKYMSDALSSLTSTAKGLPKAIMGEKQETAGEKQDKEKLPLLADYGGGKTGKFGEAGVAIVLAIAMVFGGWGALKAFKSVEKPLRPANFQDLIRKKDGCIQEIGRIEIKKYNEDQHLNGLLDQLNVLNQAGYDNKVKPLLEADDSGLTATLRAQHLSVEELLSLERKLEKALKKLYTVENDTLKLKKEIEKIRRLSAFENEKTSLHNAIRDVVHILDDYFGLTNEETMTEQRLQHITDANQVKSRMNRYWEEKSAFGRLKAVFTKHIAQYEKLKKALDEQKRAMDKIIPLCREIERQEAEQQTPPATTTHAAPHAPTTTTPPTTTDTYTTNPNPATSAAAPPATPTTGKAPAPSH